MNYRHAFHAGNFADCMKHALLVWLLTALQRKPGPLQVLDTHAGTGMTDLSGAEARRTGEWREGIGRVDDREPALYAYREAIAAAQGHFGAEFHVGPEHYPGSPALVRALLRPQDRLVACELHEDDHASLRRLFAGDAQVSVHRRDGYGALASFLPPASRRGLTLIDPPFEQPDEFDRLVAAASVARRRFATGVLALWYPIKGRAPSRRLHDLLVQAAPNGLGLRDVVAAELLLREPVDPARLNGAGLVVIRPPYGFEAAAGEILAALHRALAGEPGAQARLVRLADE
ncbi:23S rRNA (adenine2030-N6)-methyltransferase [Endobacter medicaginis]|uniref:Ribosomal RNA large subunit methyltransferase J n=2 Tax=Endobacter medicaginis TaxID=1181271 RepID=A0A839UX31_9PROT|nr:23S rRNA (adenine2030-N6)-methyltransferase [Endobacter medicaginis]MCX5475338.1 23S rRNA (adenine(2030)-N(6))-methyltransferase RlmJ [Endobacter medicaginis]